MVISRCKFCHKTFKDKHICKPDLSTDLNGEITQLKARMTLLEEIWIAHEKHIDSIVNKIDGIVDLFEKNPKLIE